MSNKIVLEIGQESSVEGTMTALIQGLANYGPERKLGLLFVFLNEVLLEHIHQLTYYLWPISCFNHRVWVIGAEIV